MVWIIHQLLPWRKTIASEVAMRHTIEAVQVHGGYGYVKEYHVERLMRGCQNHPNI